MEFLLAKCALFVAAPNSNFIQISGKRLMPIVTLLHYRLGYREREPRVFYIQVVFFHPGMPIYNVLALTYTPLTKQPPSMKGNGNSRQTEQGKTSNSRDNEVNEPPAKKRKPSDAASCDANSSLRQTSLRGATSRTSNPLYDSPNRKRKQSPINRRRKRCRKRRAGTSKSQLSLLHVANTLYGCSISCRFN